MNLMECQKGRNNKEYSTLVIIGAKKYSRSPGRNKDHCYSHRAIMYLITNNKKIKEIQEINRIHITALLYSLLLLWHINLHTLGRTGSVSLLSTVLVLIRCLILLSLFISTSTSFSLVVVVVTVPSSIGSSIIIISISTPTSSRRIIPTAISVPILWITVMRSLLPWHCPRSVQPHPCLRL